MLSKSFPSAQGIRKAPKVATAGDLVAEEAGAKAEPGAARSTAECNEAGGFISYKLETFLFA